MTKSKPPTQPGRSQSSQSSQSSQWPQRPQRPQSNHPQAPWPSPQMGAHVIRQLTDLQVQLMDETQEQMARVTKLIGQGNYPPQSAPGDFMESATRTMRGMADATRILWGIGSVASGQRFERVPQGVNAHDFTMQIDTSLLPGRWAKLTVSDLKGEDGRNTYVLKSGANVELDGKYLRSDVGLDSVRVVLHTLSPKVPTGLYVGEIRGFEVAEEGGTPRSADTGTRVGFVQVIIAASSDPYQ